MEQNMKENFNRIIFMVLENMIFMMVDNMLENGKLIKCGVMEKFR